MPSGEFIIALIAFVGAIFLGLFTYLKNPKSITNTLFFFFVLSLTAYVAVNYLALHQKTNEMTLLWVRTIMAIALIINLLYFLLVSAFPRTKLQLSKKILYGAIGLTLILLPITQSNLIYKAVEIGTVNIRSVPGQGMPLFLLHTLVFIGGGFILLIRKYLKSVGLEKTQVRFFLLGTVFMFLAILITDLLFVLIFNISFFTRLLPIYILIFVNLISYAIVKHRFLDIRLLVARSVAYVLLLFIFATFYTGAIFTISSFYFNRPYQLKEAIVYTILTLFAAFTFQPLKKIIEQVTDSIFFRNRYDSSDLLSRLTKIMATTLHPQDLTRSTLHTILKSMHIMQGVFLIYEDKAFLAPIHEGFSQEPHYDVDDIQELSNYKRLLVFDEEEGSIKAKMRQINAAIVQPLFVGGYLQGVLLLGDKQSGDIYSQQDINLLGIFGPEISVALQNANSYEEIRKFNITLREEIKKATEDLRVANERLRELDKLKDDFVSVASHELRTPMTAIKSYLWMALHKTQNELSEKMSRYLDRSYMSVERLISLVNDMLNISRIEGGRIALKLDSIDIVDLAKEVKEEVSAKAGEKNIEVIVDEQDLPRVLCDKDKIHQVYLNLIGNSLKFTENGGKITVHFEKQGDFVNVSVTDTGHGIAQEDLARLFKKFGRLDNSYVAMAESTGTGLGLYITKSLIELHKGTVKGESEGVGKGATFSFTLPIVGTSPAAQLGKDAPKETNDTKGLEPVTLQI